MTHNAPENIPERRKEDKVLEARFNAFQEATNKRLSRWFKVGLGSMAVIAVTSAFALFGYGYVIGEIQDQRRDACNETNKRNERTIRILTAFSIQNIENAKTPAEKKQAEEAQAYTGLLINALAPRRKCSDIAPTGYLPL